jgi:uncharacterized protein YutE (UPF0331/DUF86 family)
MSHALVAILSNYPLVIAGYHSHLGSPDRLTLVLCLQRLRPQDTLVADRRLCADVSTAIQATPEAHETNRVLVRQDLPLRDQAAAITAPNRVYASDQKAAERLEWGAGWHLDNTMQALAIHRQYLSLARSLLSVHVAPSLPDDLTDPALRYGFVVCLESMFELASELDMCSSLDVTGGTKGSTIQKLLDNDFIDHADAGSLWRAAPFRDSLIHPTSLIPAEEVKATVAASLDAIARTADALAGKLGISPQA